MTELKQTGAGARPQSATGEHARALADLFERHNRELVLTLRKRLGNEAEAREVAQEAYARMLQLEEPDAVSFLRAYLYRTALNIAGDRLRRLQRDRRHAEPIDAADFVDERDPQRQLESSQMLDRVWQGLEELPDRYREVFRQFRFEDRSVTQIADQVGLKGTQIRLYIRRSMAYCRLRAAGLTADEAHKEVFP